MQQLHWSKARRAISLRQGSLEFKLGRAGLEVWPRYVSQVCPSFLRKKDRLTWRESTFRKPDVPSGAYTMSEWLGSVATRSQGAKGRTCNSSRGSGLCLQWTSFRWCLYHLLKVTIRVIRESTNTDLCLSADQGFEWSLRCILTLCEILYQKESTVQNWIQGGNTNQAWQELEECRAEAKHSKQLFSAEALLEKSKMVQVPNLSSQLQVLEIIETYTVHMWERAATVYCHVLFVISMWYLLGWPRLASFLICHLSSSSGWIAALGGEDTDGWGAQTMIWNHVRTGFMSGAMSVV